VVWPEPCADEMPDPELLDYPELPDPVLLDPVPFDPVLPEDPELLDDPELPEAEPVPDELEPPLAADEPVPAPLAVLVWCVAPGRAKTITPAPTRPAAPTVTVAARSRACPRRRAAAAAHAFGCGEFIGIPSWFSPQSGCRVWGTPAGSL
jgi:hypothetical protein